MLFLKHKYSTEDLIAKCKTADRKCQELLYKQFASKMLAVCMRYAVDKMEAEDMLQNGFVRVFQKINDYRGDGSFEGWMRRIMVHSSIEYYRKHHKMTLVDIDESGYEQPVNAAAASSLETKDLMALIQQLPAGYRMVFNLYAIEGYSHREIADIADITEGASKSQLSRARTLLKQKIEQLEGKLYEYAG
ncbi:sigma-70 family RNA polymerase sigma factor [Mucilaginibacter sp. HME9299]|uniref:Sigma-70 family RNA polymerase sigma factor n=1 Tax=Mucilaginibacter aquatilis TaxID=1517760 RepID=A0A6I4I511_9SPHI|nr:sigma-70 family RNA polymerase sigma factor [Mucilaginibacter aquatilis]MVN90162.1 sigma-70 family RNA polymerase sigma factor [Mucilaginibacter aquatilis]